MKSCAKAAIILGAMGAIAIMAPRLLEQKQAQPRSIEFGIPLSDSISISSGRKSEYIRREDLEFHDAGSWESMRLFSACACRGDELAKIANAHFCPHIYVAYTPSEQTVDGIGGFGKFLLKRAEYLVTLKFGKIIYGERSYIQLKDIIAAQDSSLLFVQNESYDAMLLKKVSDKAVFYRLNQSGEKKLANNKVFSSYDSSRKFARESKRTLERIRNLRN